MSSWHFYSSVSHGHFSRLPPARIDPDGSIARLRLAVVQVVELEGDVPQDVLALRVGGLLLHLASAEEKPGRHVRTHGPLRDQGMNVCVFLFIPCYEALVYGLIHCLFWLYSGKSAPKGSKTTMGS